MLSGCQSSAQKVENAEDKVVEAKEDLVDSKTELVQARQDSISDYLHFKKEAEESIIAQEKNITEFKAKIANEKMEVKADYEKKLDELGIALKDLTFANTK